MSDDRSEETSPGGAWADYWRHTPEAASYRGGGPQDEVLARVWSGVFSLARASGRDARVLDFACGNGAVSRFAVEGVDQAGFKPVVIGLDGADSAARAYRASFPGFSAVVADIRHAPFADGSFDVVASQFGLEYAGIEGIAEAARLVAPGGLLAAVMHMKEGALYRECAINREAVARIRESAILSIVKEVFRRGAAVARGQGSRSAFRQADERLAGAVRAVEGVLLDAGDAVAGGAVRRLYTDLAHMYGRLTAYDSAEVARWADRMAREIDAYHGRMTAMLAAALDAAAFDAWASRAHSQGLAVRVSEALLMGSGGGEPAAWLLACERR